MNQPTAPQYAGFELLQERQTRGIIGRFLLTLRHILGLFFGGLAAYIRWREAQGEGGALEVLLLRFLFIFIWLFLDKQIASQPFPVQFRRRLELLGPTYIKLGQILSLREDLLPKPLTDELKNLLDRLPVVSFERYQELVEADLKRPLDTIFQWIDPIPLGSASLAQTHRARLRTREDVVIKLLKPGVRKTIERDTKLLRLFGRILQLFLSRYQPGRLINEFCTYTLREVDFNFEANNAETFAANFRDEPDIRFPKIYRQFSTNNILCMEFFRGVKPDAAAQSLLTEQEKDKVIRLGVSAIVRMIFRDGFFHADLHPGNLIIFEDARIGFIDLGMVGRFDQDMQKRMFYYFYSLVIGDSANAARYLAAIAIPGQKSDLDGFRRALAELYWRWLRSPTFHEFSLAQVILQSVVLAGQYHIQYPGELILMVKALVTVEGVGNLLHPGLDVTGVARSPVQKILRQQFNPVDIFTRSVIAVPELIDILSLAPLVLNEGIRYLENNLKRSPPRRLSGISGAVFAGLCLVAAALIVSLGGPWPLWLLLFILGIIVAFRA
jgi:ubiquinone biosynthesis protein